ncbi:MAG: HlyC/CorC family transporter [Gemmataceae bacterium]|nr:HlyC/CorC family transporter [Gemmataceae bacterium]
MCSVLLAASSEGSVVWTIVGLLAIPALVLLNGFFVAAEFALVAVRRTRVEEMVNQGVPGARAVETAVGNLDRAIAATQLGITLASIGLGWVAEPALAHLIEPLFLVFPDVWRVIATHSAAVAVAFFLITFMHVVFGELIPKTLALQTPDRIALWVARPLNLFITASRPLVSLMNGTGNLLIRLAGYKPPTGEELVHSIEELALLVEDTEEAGLLDPEQAELVQNVFQLSNKTVGDCMVPRERMATLEVTLPPDKILEAVRSGAHTRMPVYDRELDNIVGIVNTKDLFYLFSLKGMVILEDALYPALFLRDDEIVANALRLFRKAHRPMALVRNQDGKILGLVTLEDILEEIIGDIEDEHDRPTPKLVRRRRLLLPPPAKGGKK